MFKNAYDRKWSDEMDEKYFSNSLVEYNKYTTGIYTLKSYFFKEELIPESAKVLEKFENGKAAITVNSYGKGKAIIVCSLLGYVYARFQFQEVADLIAGLVKDSGITCPLNVIGGKVRVDLMKNEKNDAVLVINSFEDKEITLRVKINNDIEHKSKIINLFTGKELPIKETGGIYFLELKVKPQAHDIYSIVM